MGVAPYQIPDYKALVGDASDNYKGVSGIGPKTAKKLLQKFGAIKNIINAPEEELRKLLGKKADVLISLLDEKY